jgi:hypothetical protein
MLPADSFRPGALWPDSNGVHINAHGGGVLFHEGIYYWFGEHKIRGEAGNLAQVGVHVYSSFDLYNWRDEGIALAVSADPNCPIASGCILERPKVLFNRKTEKFVMWFHLEPKGTEYRAALSGVAVAENVAGPYSFFHSFRPNAGAWPTNVLPEMKQPLSTEEEALVGSLELPGGPVPYYPKHLLFRRDFAGGQMARDQTLFLDEDGVAYHFYASEDNGTLHISRLTEDYLAPAGEYVRIFPGRFHEAPAVMKFRGRYFLFSSDCSGWAPNPARLSTTENIFGPWEELGNPCLGDNQQTTTTFHSQPAFILPVQSVPDAFVFMADRWDPADAINGRYVWLPIEFRHGVPTISWHDEWNLNHLKEYTKRNQVDVHPVGASALFDVRANE